MAMTDANTATTTSRTDRWPDALWAPSWETGNARASSPPEHHAWGAVTVVGAADGRAYGRASADAARDGSSIGRSDRWRGRRADQRRLARRPVDDRFLPWGSA